MKRYLIYILLELSLLIGLASCNHKDLCYDHRDHAHKHHINIIADYRYDWEENYGGTDWKTSWPSHYLSYDALRPAKPIGLRVVNFKEGLGSNTHNIGSDGGVVTLYEGSNDVLVYNNDTEYIVFNRSEDGNGATTRATTRTRTRSTYLGSEYAHPDEETMTAPDMLFANYLADFQVEKTSSPIDVEVTLQPLVFTYKIRYEFESGLKYVALARGALSGMARSVMMNTGVTSDESATILFDCDVVGKNDNDLKAEASGGLYGARAIVKSFGVPSYPNVNYPSSQSPSRTSPRHALNLELLLTNGNLITLDYDVTDQLLAQPHGGVIVVKGITISPEDGTQGPGTFDVEVNDWGDYEDIVLPL